MDGAHGSCIPYPFKFRWRNSRRQTRRLRARSIPASAETEINDDISMADITEESTRTPDITEEEKSLPREEAPGISDSSWITDSGSITDSLDITDNCQITDTSFITDTT